MLIPLEDVMASLDPARRKRIEEGAAQIISEHHQTMARRNVTIACTKTEKRADTIKASR